MMATLDLERSWQQGTGNLLQAALISVLDLLSKLYSVSLNQHMVILIFVGDNNEDSLHNCSSIGRNLRSFLLQNDISSLR
jgi:hypothetical protein